MADGGFLSVQETARMLSVHPNTVRNWVRNGTLRSARLAGTRTHRFLRSDVERLLQDSGVGSAPPAAVQVRASELVSAVDLDRWAARADAPGGFPDLIRRMLADSAGVSNINVRAYEGVAAHGWDGSARATGAAFLPDGDLVFEMGTSEDPARKAQEDWEHRRTVPDAGSLTFVFCTPRNWPGGRRWAQERAREQVFAAVEVFDADRLAAWLSTVPRTHQWISERLGYTPREAQTLNGWWSATQMEWTLPVPAGLFLAGRAQQRDAVQLRLQSDDPDQRVLTLRSSDRLESLAFLVAALGEASDQVLVVRSREGWDRLVAAERPLVLVPTFDRPEVGRALKRGHRVVLLAAEDEHVPTDAIQLPRIDPLEAADQLGQAGSSSLERPKMAGLARRNMPAFLRSLSRDGRRGVPSWATDAATGPLLARLLLAAGWTTGEGDVEAVSALAGEPWRQVEVVLQGSALQGTPIFRRVAQAWRVTAPTEAASFLLRRLTDADARRWREVAVRVLTEGDPLQNLEGGARLRAQMDGVGRRHSSELRRGLAQAMALVAATAADTGAPRELQEMPASIAQAVWAAAAADPSGASWRRLSEVMPLLAEAAPEAFLDALEDDLTASEPLLSAMFEDAAGSDYGFGASSAHTGLLWALEGLCWSDRYLDRAVRVLTRLATLDPGGRLVNRPIASLTGALLGWIRHSAATGQQKVELAAAVLEIDPAVGWRLIAALLPQQHPIAFTPHVPMYADWLPRSEQIGVGEWTAFESGMVALTLRAAGSEVERWGVLIAALPRLSAPDRAAVQTGIATLVRSRPLDPEDRYRLWQQLDGLIRDHEAYSDAGWALGGEALSELRAVREELHVASDPRSYRSLFGWHRTFAGLRYDEPGFHEAVAAAQTDALTTLAEQGSSALEPLLLTVQGPEAVAWKLAMLPVADRLDRPAMEWAQSTEPALAAAGAAYLGRRARLGGTAWIDRLGESLETLPEQPRADVARQFPLQRELWLHLEAAHPALVSGYWDRLDPILDDWAEYAEATAQLLVRGHAWAAVALLSFYLEEDRQPDPELVVGALTAGTMTAEPVRNRTSIPYAVEQLLGLLERELPNDDRVPQLEFVYFELLHDHEPAGALFRQLNAEPAMFLEFMAAMFRPEGVEVQERSAKDKAIADRAWSVLRAWPQIPGQRPDGTVDQDQLQAWVRAARLGLEEIGRLSIGDEQIGEILSASPPGADGLWPAEAVREVIEAVGSRRMETGLELGKYNRRGVTTRGALDGGDQERELETEHRAAAAQLHKRWTRTARVVRSLADSYGRDARRNDDEAQLQADRE